MKMINHIKKDITVEEVEKQIATTIQTCFVVRYEMHKQNPNTKPASKDLFAKIIAEKIMEEVFGVPK